MTKSLKEKNRPQLIVFALLNAIGLAMVLQGLNQVLFLLDSATKGNLGILGKIIAVPAALVFVIGVLSWATPKRWKEIMIFWRIHDCLPSNRAFTVAAHKDPRIDRRRLTKKYGELPSRPAQQTALWYSLYKKSEHDAAVEDAHCAYLRYREMTALVAIVMVCFLAGTTLIHPSSRTITTGILIIVAEYVLLLLAARNAADHFVANVLAIASTAD
jgi:hypothetical protein